MSRLPLVVVTCRTGSRAGLLDVSMLRESSEDMRVGKPGVDFGSGWKMKSSERKLGMLLKRMSCEGGCYSRFGDMVDGEKAKEDMMVVGLGQVLVK